MWWEKDNNKCDKCGQVSLKTPSNYIYSPNKAPYYSVCDKCYYLFSQYVCAVPKDYEENAYRTSVQYMFKEKKDPISGEDQIKILAIRLKSAIKQIEEITDLLIT